MQQKILAEALADKRLKINFVTDQIGDKKALKLSPNCNIFPVLDLIGVKKYIPRFGL